MDALSVIERKRDGRDLSAKEIDLMIGGFTRLEIPDSQMAAFLMAVCLRGMNAEETAALTRSMMDSGTRADLGDLDGIPVDKHSTGGVGDKISIALVPLAASLGVPVPMITGRNLGHTGGTLDKLGSIARMKFDLSPDKFRRAVRGIGGVFAGQTDHLVPADRDIYRLRDLTGTIPSIPLITASILSKKLAGGVKGLVLDVKCGRGAFMKTLPEARTLAKSLKETGELLGLSVSGIVSDMNQPIGHSVGNALEVKEAIAVLKGEGPIDTTRLTVELGAKMLVLGGKAPNLAAGRILLWEAIATFAGVDKMREIVSNQGGDPKIVDDPSRLPATKKSSTYTAAEGGYISSLDAELVGLSAMAFGAGRTPASEKINHAVGIEILKKIGDKVEPGEPIARFHLAGESRFEESIDLFEKAVRISHEPPEPPQLVIEEFD